ncbi:Fanconi anemia core complex-associated protein 100 [Bombina bombina]|uniref:Fanconi anemia core complex-associated protein 100 n=1 Tax=Bombina bombina TaxID=8345 RepID=UPI00235B0820|nr:Fanconi anemia core complex-associated protein 100 [Bombina bombina]
MPSVQYLAGFQCPPRSLAEGKGQVIQWDQDVFVSNSSMFVYVYNTDKKGITAVYLFPAEVWHIELVSSTRQLFALCAETGIYVLTWDDQGRLLKKPDCVTSVNGVDTFTVGSEFVYLLDTSVCAIMVAHEVLVVSSVHQKKWKIRIFQVESQQETVATSFRDLEFSIKLRMGCSNAMEWNGFRPVLCCVSLWKETKSSELPCSLLVESSLFTHLFGVDCSMLDSPMVLCGLPDGQVVGFPLKVAGFTNMDHTENKDTSRLPIMVLYHLEQPVVFLGATRMEVGDNNSQNLIKHNLGCDCLLIMGHEGLVVTVLSEKKTEGRGHVFREYYIQAPVSCAVSSGTGVYYSTCKDLLLVHIGPGVREENGVSNKFHHYPVLSSTSYNIPLVIAVSKISSSPEGEVQFLALSNRGKLMLCSLGRESGTLKFAGLTCRKAGQRIKDLLSGISKVSERVSHMKSLTDQRNSSLFNLNQVIGLSRTVLSSERSELALVFSTKVSWMRVVQQDSLIASCTLDNRTDCTMGRGWKLCVHIHYEASGLKTSYTFPVGNLSPGEKTEISFPLSTQKSNKLDFPVLMSSVLFYSLKGLFPDSVTPFYPAECASSSPHKQGICLPLQEHTIDILQCLRFSYQDGHQSHLDPCPAAAWDPVETFLRQSFGAGILGTHPKAVSNQGKCRVAPFSATLRVSVELLNLTLKNKSPGFSICSATLHWLLKTELTENLSEVHGFTPDGRELCLRLREVSVNDLSTSGPISAVEIQIVSAYLDVLACLHLAVLSRLQVLVCKSNSDDCGARELNLGALQQLFTVGESLLKEVHALRDRLCVEKELSSETAAERLLHIFGELRDTGLLLL